MEEAVALIAERAAKGPSKGRGRKTVQKAAKPKTAKKPAAKQKAPAKKAATKA
jgi:DNA topoisomerase-1